MSENPLNLLVRFLLEILLIVIFGYWGWKAHYSFSGPIAGILLPAVAATIWGVFRVEGDPGKAVIPVPGWLRLLYELLLFTGATLMLFNIAPSRYAILFGVTWCIHYLISYDRILRLLKIESTAKRRDL